MRILRQSIHEMCNKVKHISRVVSGTASPPLVEEFVEIAEGTKDIPDNFYRKCFHLTIWSVIKFSNGIIIDFCRSHSTLGQYKAYSNIFIALLKVSCIIKFLFFILTVLVLRDVKRIFLKNNCTYDNNLHYLNIRSSNDLYNNDNNYLMYANAWGQAIHEAIGMTTMSALQGKAVSQIRRLMNGKDVVDVSFWGDKVALKHTSMNNMHLQGQDIRLMCGRVVQDDKNCAHGRCLVNSIKYFFRKLTTQEGDSELSQVVNSSMSKDKEEIYDDSKGVNPYIEFESPEGIHFTDSDAVKYLISLIADLHQPLHFGFLHDNYGKNVFGLYETSDGTIDNVTLYEIWENSLVNKYIEDKQHYWFSGWTHVNAIKAFYEEEKKRFEERGEAMFDEWAEENLKLLCNIIYTDDTSKKLVMYASSSVNSTTVSGTSRSSSDSNDHVSVSSHIERTSIPTIPFTVSRRRERQWVGEIKQQILVAGARLAIVLNFILHNRGRHIIFRPGSAIMDVDEVADVKESSLPLWLKNFTINLLIIIIVLLLFAYLTKFYTTAPIGEAKVSPFRAMKKGEDNISLSNSTELQEKAS